jgi:hypothetical protein
MSMQRSYFKSLVLVLALPCGAGAASAAEPAGDGIAPPSDYQHAKLGLWEQTITSTSGPAPQWPPGAMDLSGMSAEERARVEAVLKRQREHAKAQGSAPRVTTKTKQFCVRQADIDGRKGSLFGDKPPRKEDHCSTREMARSSSRVSLQSECMVQGTKMTTDVTYEIRSPTEFAGAVSSSGTYNGQPMKSSETLSAHWVAASCGSVK